MSAQIEEGHPHDNGCVDGLLALRRTPGADTMSCRECPYPFCVRAEANKMRNLARDITIMAMSAMHASARVIAEKVGMGVHTIYDVVEKNKTAESCYWCRMNFRGGGVFCRTGSCTVAYDSNSIAVTLTSHREAAPNEFGAIETLVETLFPDGVLVNANEVPHSHWVINRVGEDEAISVYNHMTELATHTMYLR